MKFKIEDSIRFRASLPPIQSAINLDGNGDGARIKLDVPRTDVEAILHLQQRFTNRSFWVIIVSEDIS